MKDEKSMTRHEALLFLLSTMDYKQMGENSVVFGEKNNYAKVHLMYSDTYGHYDRLHITVHDEKPQKETYTILITKYVPAGWSHPSLKAEQCGHYWSYNGKFYGFTPVGTEVRKELGRILDFYKIKW